MIKITDDCTGCGSCAEGCPRKCITMEENVEGFLYPRIKQSECIGCNKCERNCPLLNRSLIKNHDKERAYAARVKNDTIRGLSSSGGIFYALAFEVIESGGIVFGASFDQDWKVVHIGVQSKNDLIQLQGSKYVQSNAWICFSAVRENLSSGREVLFSGTPCQIEGLLGYLGKKYENLLTVSVACHGVPSLRLWSEYVEWLKTKRNSTVKDFKFRDKTTGWRNYSVCCTYECNESYSDYFMSDPYMKLFVNNISLRKSCFDCRFRGENSNSDIILGDFWGINEFVPEMDDNYGTSLVLLRNENALAYWNRISEEIEFREVDYIKALNSNRALYKNPILLRNRKKFFESNHNYNIPFDKSAEKFTKPPFWKRLALTLIDKIHR